MERDSYRRRLGSCPFRSPQDSQLYSIPFSDWKTYKTENLPFFRSKYYRYRTVDDLATEEYQHSVQVGGQDFKFVLWRGSVCDLEVDAIVNAANGSLLGGGGVDGAIHDAAGYMLARECAERYEAVDTCGTVITKGYYLPAHYVIHTVGPVYYDERRHAAAKLQLCYLNTFKLCETFQLSSLATCCVSCGIYGYPPEEASGIAISEALKWVQSGKQYPKLFIFVLFTGREIQAYRAAFTRIMKSPEASEPGFQRTISVEEGKSQISMRRTASQGQNSQEEDLYSSNILEPRMEKLTTSQKREEENADGIQGKEKEGKTQELETGATGLNQEAKPQRQDYETIKRESLTSPFKNLEDKFHYDVPLLDWKRFKIEQRLHFVQERYHQKPISLLDLKSIAEVTLQTRVNQIDFSFFLIQGNIALLETSAVIDAVYETLLGVREIDQSILEGAGYLLLKECAGRFDIISPGESIVTKGYDLPADYVIHTLGPVYNNPGAPELLRQCYRASFRRCQEVSADSLGLSPFYGYPLSEASLIAVQETFAWVRAGNAEIRTFIFVVKTEEEKQAYKTALETESHFSG